MRSHLWLLLSILGLIHHAHAAEYKLVREIVPDPQGRIWVIAQGGGTNYGTSFSRFENGAWHTAMTGEMFQSLSFSPQGTPLFAAFNDVKWDRKVLPSGRFFRACNMAVGWNGEKEFYLGTLHGAIRYAMDPTGFPVPQEALGLGVTIPDSMPHIAVAGGRLWAANPVGLLSMPLPGGDWNLVRTADLGGEVSGLKAGTGNSLWIGLNGARFPAAYWWRANFSSRGLRLHDGKNLVTWRKSNSGLPSDTLEAVHPVGDSALLIATAQGIHLFTRNGTVTRICPPLTAQTASLFQGPDGTIYAGSKDGLFKWQGNERYYIGYPVTGPAGVSSGSSSGSAAGRGAWRPWKPFGKNGERSVDGRRILR